MAELAGSRFRDEIARVLRAKYRSVETEHRLTATTADVVFIDDTNPVFPRFIAIEAKDWKKPFTSEDLAKIENLYRPSINAREIDFLWIIGNHVLASSPKDTLGKFRHVQYSTFSEFQSSMMNFTGILQDNILEFQQIVGIDNYIQAKISGTDVSLFDHTLKWLSTDLPGLIVFGGYGLGKTTFSLFLASKLSDLKLQSRFDRIPIRISLGRMYTKQDVASLICAALSGAEGRSSVRDFSYNLFIEANALGHYLIILDGFDEMKHAMDLEDFNFTFEQMKPLFRGKAKVILLGRPDPFVTEGEESEVLANLFEYASGVNKLLDRAEISLFNNSEIREYLSHYIAKRPTKLTQSSRERFNHIVEVMISEGSVLSRPVQLKMFTEIMEAIIEKDTPFSRYELYNEFIFRFILRENRKDARRLASPSISSDLTDDRAKFMMQIAWWILLIKKENRFIAGEIPLNFIPRSIRGTRDSPAAVREAILGSVIEPMGRSKVIDKKGRRYYYFPHKSYIEFLVAIYFGSNRLDKDDYRLFFYNVNSEILSFIAEGPIGGIKNLRNGLLYYVGDLSSDIMEVCILDKDIEGEISVHNSYNTAPLIFTHYFFIKKNQQDAVSFIRRKFSEARTLSSAIAVVNCACAEMRRTADIDLARIFLFNLITSLSPQSFSQLNQSGPPVNVYHADYVGFCASILLHCIEISRNKQFLILRLAVLEDLAFYSARSSFHMDLSQKKYMANNLKVSIDSLTAGMHVDWIEMITNAVNRSDLDGPHFKIVLHGEAGKSFSLPPKTDNSLNTH